MTLKGLAINLVEATPTQLNKEKLSAAKDRLPN